MTASPSGKSPHRARRRSTGHGRTRSDIRQSPQIVRQFEELDAVHRSSVNRFPVEELVASAQFTSASSPAALKSP
jgi:hypothetical protein